MKTLLLLHGAIGSSAQLQPLAGSLAADYDVHTLDFSGHGGKPLGNVPFSIELFANDVLSYMMLHGLSSVSIFGYSMGGYVAMYLAKHYPEKVDKIITLATKFHWDVATAAREVQMLQPEKIEQKLPDFANTLKERHAPTDWHDVLTRTAAMLLAMGADNPLSQPDYTAIQSPSLLLLGDRDKMVTLNETVSVFNSLPAARLGVLPATPHAIEQVGLPLLCFYIKEFIG